MLASRILVIVLVLLLGGALPIQAQQAIESQTLRPQDPTPELRFGWSVAVEGDLLAVGAPGDRTHGPRSGAAFIYEWDGNDWARTKLVPPDGETDARFGWKVAIDRGRVVVTAPWASNPVEGRSGTIYVYTKGNGTWQPEGVRVPDPDVEGQVGRGMAADAGRIVVGAPYDRTRHGANAGSVVVLEEGADGWTGETLVPASGTPNAWFGMTVAAQGDRIAAGAYATEQPSGAEAGAASLFERSATGTWTETPLAPFVTPERKDHFGRSVALRGPWVFVGAEEDDNANGQNAGGVFAIRPDADRVRLLVPDDGRAREYVGFAVAATDTFVAAYARDDVVLFRGDVESMQPPERLNDRLEPPVPGNVSALAADGMRLVVGTAYVASGEVPQAGAVVVVEGP